MNRLDKIYVVGSNTVVGRALLCVLRDSGYQNLYPIGDKEPNLLDKKEVESFFKEYHPDYVFLAGGKSGGIKANQRFPASLMLNNLMIECHVMDAAFSYGAKKLLYIASSCCYPKHCEQPMKPESLFTGKLEPTNEAYATAKLAGIVLCQAYRKEHQANFLVVIPSNPYGPGDDFSLEDSHVVPALLRKMHEAKEKGDPVVEIWGSGKPKRDFIFSHDLAEACLFLMEKVDSELPINVGSGEGNTIAETALLAKGVVGYEGKLQFNASMPDGMPMKILDSSWINQLGWKAKTPLKEGMKITYEWFLKNKEKLEEKHAVYG